MMSGNDEGWGTGSRSHEERIQLLRRLRRLNNLARLLDTAVRVPGTGIRFGADSLLGLLPVIGDASGAIIGLAIVNEGRKLGVPSDKLARMLTNIAVDAAVGSVPLLGDVFDVYFKAHKRNIGIILDHFDVEAAELAEPRRR
ncbi:conserved protein of unknown function [Pseudorhizobium banfieldiae]|uniref:DUF4112 domain-containing protein n=1 Tax=Pseudorhizobium banfieldiae TaxID=1125847 RepID=L0NI06_9HYPH|nr:DUF4112 domain-containing protein [Pseudorhizobium banfieldiae]CAD6617208.1 hypothetical protein RNT25_03312 [arsenite-oxidising bacterium NT-25]CCF20705.1 conserved protein of unknown function [Pseudorhizobium banfieldiae]